MPDVRLDVQGENDGDRFVAKTRSNDFSTQSNNKFFSFLKDNNPLSAIIRRFL
ncbi:hypothetical protein KPK_B0079 (plasmid) [Klebsiella variicola]|jgi:hypothetical protein|uniref:Uncharacterized protein n=1 Tax=Klebsiella variicola (strain 342) TaxID=507522 RepID=B5RKN5_KLEV3|nr:hypothetical protein KPK_B0079 [Klebsiella variicola]